MIQERFHVHRTIGYAIAADCERASERAKAKTPRCIVSRLGHAAAGCTGSSPSLCHLRVAFPDSLVEHHGAKVTERVGSENLDGWNLRSRATLSAADNRPSSESVARYDRVKSTVRIKNAVCHYASFFVLQSGDSRIRRDARATLLVRRNAGERSSSAADPSRNCSAVNTISALISSFPPAPFRPVRRTVFLTGAVDHVLRLGVIPSVNLASGSYKFFHAPRADVDGRPYPSSCPVLPYGLACKKT